MTKLRVNNSTDDKVGVVYQLSHIFDQQGINKHSSPVVLSTETRLISTKFVHCFTLGWREQKTEQTKLYSRVNTKSRTNTIRKVGILLLRGINKKRNLHKVS